MWVCVFAPCTPCSRLCVCEKKSLLIWKAEIGLCVCVLDQWDLINGESKADWSRHSSKQSQSNHPSTTACRSSQQIKTLMDIDQIPSNKPTAIILSQPSFAFLTHASVCVASRRTVLLYRRCFGEKEQQKQKSLLSAQITGVSFPFPSTGLMSVWVTVLFCFFVFYLVYHCIDHYMQSFNNNLRKERKCWGRKSYK